MRKPIAEQLRAAEAEPLFPDGVGSIDRCLTRLRRALANFGAKADAVGASAIALSRDDSLWIAISGGQAKEHGALLDAMFEALDELSDARDEFSKESRAYLADQESPGPGDIN